ncbi:glycogen phosphorylase [Rhodopirellula maiorica SM1]|uniref:Alpha-1,4 glucan phosphorylase n=1 Tax=Rhodopirellula maiorica SM1 TaxID=1265738 RepID=M5RKX1_9BACT|nr:glycogen/starch/alpha-glucan phosphorylase [Rhodopirellula maiorica]EMI19821.1 glycogen phosphorylase [Rhodopirellula maiorica SM1]
MTKTVVNQALKQHERKTVRFSDKAGYERYQKHLLMDHVVLPEAASQRERFEAVARSLRDLLTERWLHTQQTHDKENPKRVYYLSMEFLIGRTLTNNIINLGVEDYVREELQADPHQDWTEVVETEPDAGLGNGGLGRLAACFIESLATLQIPAMGYGLRYEYGIFRQVIENGFQIEQPDHWLAQPDPWEVAQPRQTVQIPVGCQFELHDGVLQAKPGLGTHLLGVPYDRPVVGYGGQTINTLRLWGAATPDHFDFGEFSSGDFVGAIVDRILAETVTRVLYPDDSTRAGQALRFVQEYFLVCCSLADIVARFQRTNDDWQLLPQKVAIQLNDTHPAMAVAELMRILLDDAELGWDETWDLTVRTLAYTNHTLLPEALEKWPVRFFELVCPRSLEIIHEINRRFLADVQQRYPDDDQRASRLSLVEEGGEQQIRMANLAIVGTHSTNGVAKIHSDLLRTRVVSEFAEMFPERFNNKTNGVTPRRWLLAANRDFASLITESIGDRWIADLSELRHLMPLAEDATFRQRFLETKQTAKKRFASWLESTAGQQVNPETIFDSQIKRIHEYKRQLLNILHVIVLYNRLRENLSLAIPPRTFFFAGKAAPAYRLAKLIVKLINNVGRVIDEDPATAGRIKVAFVPNYNVSVAERLIPASDVSEQISTAGYEASGTGNMKFMMNGALTIGTRDGATIEMAEEAGEENFFLFGLTAEQVAESRSYYNPRWHYDNDPETRAALDLIFNDHFSRDEPGIFTPIRESLMDRGDYFMHLADLTSYAEAQQKLGELYADPDAWARKAIINVACSGRFSSDRTIAEYAAEIWDAEPCPVT